MLGKRPHQIQRTTSMTQLRVPPGTRPRTPARDFMPQRPRKPVDANTHHVHSRAPAPPETLRRLEVEPVPHIIVPATACMHITDVFPPSAIPVHMPSTDHLKAPSASPLPLSTMSTAYSWMPSSLFAKATTMSESFMDACFSCKKPLEHGRDIFMYRGDAAFCSEDCRLWQITYDEHRQKCSASANSQGATSGEHVEGASKSTTSTSPLTGAL